MTDKQIIIDGVDVHWCEHYTGNIGYLTDKNWTCRAKIQGTKCEDWSNCYFKRWQRKEQECEKLKDKLNCCFCKPQVGLEDMENFKKCVETTECFRRQLDQLKAENKELKKQVYKYEQAEKYPAAFLWQEGLL